MLIKQDKLQTLADAESKFMKLLNKKFLGSGTHWTVHELQFEPPGYPINDSFYSTVAQKTSKNLSRGSIQHNLQAYRRIRQAGIPTLFFFEKAEIDGVECIICENLFHRERLYVSPNTARNMQTAMDLLRIKLLTINKSKEELTPECPSIAEDFQKRNKIRRIINFEQFVELLEKEITKGTKHGIGFGEDMFFFGTNYNPESTLDFLVADFDTFIDLDSSASVFLKNKITGLSSLYEFIDQFVEDSEEKSQYIQFIQDRKKKLGAPRAGQTR